MDGLYELVLDCGEVRVVETDSVLDVGDAVILDNEIWLVLREATRPATKRRARFECRRALQLQAPRHRVVAAAKSLGLEFTVAHEVRAALERTG